jgi:hypothetical protein
MKYTSFVELVNCADLAFVARAVSNNENRPQFWYMKIEERDGGLSAIATNGKRIHKAQLSKMDVPGISPGYWRVLKNKTVKMRNRDLEDLEGHWHTLVYIRKKILWLTRLDAFDLFPDDESINSIFPQGEPLREGTVSTHKYHLDSMNVLIKNLPDSAGINLEYLRDLGPHEWKYKIFAHDKPVLFEHENRTALIMPLFLNQIK